MTEAEQAQWDGIQVGTVDQEIRMAKIMLNRCLELNARINADPNTLKNTAGLELSEIKSSEEGVSTTSRRPDTLALIDRYMGRIASLEKTRAELIAATRDTGNDPNDAARRILDAVAAMNAVEFGEYWDVPNDEARAEAIEAAAAAARERKAQTDTGNGA